MKIKKISKKKKKEIWEVIVTNKNNCNKTNNNKGKLNRIWVQIELWLEKVVKIGLKIFRLIIKVYNWIII